MIKIIHYLNESAEKPLEASISKYYDEVRELLPELPKTVKIYFSDYGIIPESGVGGFAYSHDTITISIDPDFQDKKKQLKDIRPTIFHEVFHQYQNYTGGSGPFSAIENAIYEGMATIFEREYCKIWQPYGDYRKTSEDSLKQWLKDLQQLSLEDFQNSYSEWKFYHPKLKERWIVYKVGTWIADQVLEKQKLTILDLSTKTATDVLELYEQYGSRPEI
ncbi:MAG TPA: DUF2268 domain-containing putative Zn-dependent protease [Patescibacteria group bacterium]|jgi:uncharacterized protein YjaZ|nr:DUF2268 domain-containing putative Zn-dependent protease [Patescibacteria group bacterium]